MHNISEPSGTEEGKKKKGVNTTSRLWGTGGYYGLVWKKAILVPSNQLVGEGGRT